MVGIKLTSLVQDSILLGRLHDIFQFFGSLILNLIFITQINAQVGNPLFENLNDQFPGIEKVVLSIQRDCRGYVWFGGLYHLQRFDGIRINNYQIRSYSEGKNSGGGSIIYEDSENNLWVLCNGQILLYDPIYDDFNYLKLELPAFEGSVPHFTTICEDANKRLWIGFGSNMDYLLIRIPIDTLIERINEGQNLTATPVIPAEDFDQFPSDFSQIKRFNNSVFNIDNIITDRNGDVWICRDGWLERYVENEESIGGEFIKYLETVDNEGFVLGTGRRVVRINNTSETVRLKAFLDNDKNLWASTANYLYQFIDSPINEAIPIDSILSFPSFFQSIYTEAGSNKFDKYQDKLINVYDFGINTNYVGGVDLKRRNLFWLFQKNGNEIDAFTLKSGDNKTMDFEKLPEIKKNPESPNSWKNELYHQFVLDNEGIFWSIDRNTSGYDSEGVLILNTNNMEMFTKSDSLNLINILCIHRDYRDNIWFFPFELDPGEFVFQSDQYLRNIKKISFSNNHPIYFDGTAWEDSNHNLWVQGGGHILVVNLPQYYSDKSENLFYEFTPQNFNIEIPEGDSLVIADLILDKTQTLWVYAFTRNRSNEKWVRNWGLHYFDLKESGITSLDQFRKIKFHKYIFNSKSDDFYVTFKDKGRNFWSIKPVFINNKTEKVYLLTPTSLIRIDPETRDYDIYKTGNNDPGSPFTDVWWASLVIDDSKKDTMSVYGCYYDFTATGMGYLKRITFLDQENRKQLHSVISYESDIRFPEMPSPILMDSQSNLWFIADNAGIFRFEPDKNLLRHYNNIYTWNATFGVTRFRDSKGYMYFTATNGLVRFLPDSIRDKSSDFKVNIHDINVMGRSIVKNKDSTFLEGIKKNHTLILSHDNNMVSFSFSLMNLTDKDQNHYKYILDGWDEELIETDVNSPIAVYSHLLPGSYTFRVLGSDTPGLWKNNATTLDVLVIPPWWFTWWAYTLYILFAFGLLFGSVRFLLVRNYLKKTVALKQLEVEKMMELDTMKSQFFANVSHEFRTPLSLILGPLKLLLSNEKDAYKKDKLSMIGRNSRKLLFLVNQLLDFTKLKTGRLILQAQETNITEFVKKRFSSFESLAESQGIHFEFQSEKDDVYGYIDQDKLEKIIVNLISNSFKFIGKGDSILVKVKTAHIPEIESGSGAICISVRDNGIGIDPDKLSTIFERYYQVPDSISGIQGGSGLGLTLVKEMVELHHGIVKVKSRKGKGSTFKVYLPLGKGHLTDDEVIPAGELSVDLIYDQVFARNYNEKSNSSDLTLNDDLCHLLVIDDNSDMRAFIREIFAGNFNIEEASNGKRGLEVAIEKIPDLIISDIMMPEMDGNELCEKLKSDERISHIPIILLTAKAGQTDRLSGLSIGADDYITKPFSADELRVRAKNLIDQRRKMRERFSRDITLLPKDIAITSADERFLLRAMKILEEHSIYDEFGPNQFSKEIGISRSQLHRKIKALTDQSAGEFIRSYRLNHARQLLESHYGNIAEIAYEVGFNNPSYFTECFKAQFGVLPSEYAQTL